MTKITRCAQKRIYIFRIIIGSCEFLHSTLKIVKYKNLTELIAKDCSKTTHTPDFISLQNQLIRDKS